MTEKEISAHFPTLEEDLVHEMMEVAVMCLGQTQINKLFCCLVSPYDRNFICCIFLKRSTIILFKKIESH